MDTRSFRTRWLLALGALGLLTGLGWIASRIHQDAALHRMWVEKELRMVALDLAQDVDGDALAGATSGYDLERPGEVLEGIGGYACVEPLPPGIDATVQGQTWLEEAATEATGDSVVTAVVPVLDAAGAPAGRLRVTAPAHVSRWKLLLRIGLMGLLVVSVVAMVLAAVDRALRSHCEALEALATGRASEVVRRSASREMHQLALAMNPKGRTLQPSGAEPVAAAPASAPRPAAPVPEPMLPPAPDPHAERPELYSPQGIVQEVKDSLETRVRARGLQLCMRIEDRVPNSVLGMSSPVVRSLRALVHHALKSTQQGSVLVRVAHEVHGARLRYEVLDPGHGLSHREQDSLRTELEAVRPSDLDSTPPLTGPHLAQALLRPLGGRVEFDSHRGAGSRFWFTLPYEPAPALPSSAPAASAPSATSGPSSASTFPACFATS